MTAVILRSMKTAISVPDPIFRQAERAARRLGISRSEFFARAAQRFVASLRDDAVRASYDAAFATPAPRAETKLRRKAARKALAAIEWDDE